MLQFIFESLLKPPHSGKLNFNFNCKTNFWWRASKFDHFYDIWQQLMQWTDWFKFIEISSELNLLISAWFLTVQLNCGFLELFDLSCVPGWACITDALWWGSLDWSNHQPVWAGNNMVLRFQPGLNVMYFSDFKNIKSYFIKQNF